MNANAAAAKAAKQQAAKERAEARARAAREKAAAKAKAAEQKAAAKAKAAAAKAAKQQAAKERAEARASAARERAAAKAKAAEERARKTLERQRAPKLERPRAKIRPPSPSSPAPATAQPIEDLIRAAYLRETNGRVKERVLLKDLRPKVEVARDAFDQALLSMQQRSKVVLMGLDNPSERTSDIEAAALHIAGRPRHLVYFQG